MPSTHASRTTSRLPKSSRCCPRAGLTTRQPSGLPAEAVTGQAASHRRHLACSDSLLLLSPSMCSNCDPRSFIRLNVRQERGLSSQEGTGLLAGGRHHAEAGRSGPVLRIAFPQSPRGSAIQALPGAQRKRKWKHLATRRAYGVLCSAHLTFKDNTYSRVGGQRGSSVSEIGTQSSRPTSQVEDSAPLQQGDTQGARSSERWRSPRCL